MRELSELIDVLPGFAILAGFVEKPTQEFDIFLETIGNNKINTIKEIRTITGLGLREAKDLVDYTAAGRVTLIRSRVSSAIADQIIQDLYKVSQCTATKKVSF